MEKQWERFLIGNQFGKFMNSQMEGVCKKYGAKKIEMNVFMYLIQADDFNTASDIQKYLNLNKGYLSHVLEEMCRKGFLQAAADENDRRYVHYFPTEQAGPLMEELIRIKTGLDEKMFYGVTDEEFQVLKRVADKIDGNIREMLKNGKDGIG